MTGYIPEAVHDQRKLATQSATSQSPSEQMQFLKTCLNALLVPPGKNPGQD